MPEVRLPSIDPTDGVHSTIIAKKEFTDASSDEISLENKPQVAGETFATGAQTRFYKPIDTYEGRHRWDPNAEWTEQEERKIVRKVPSRRCRT